LSLGCTSAHLDIAWTKGLSRGASYWAARMADLFMKAQSSSAIATAETLIGKGGIHRINPDHTGEGFTFDDVRRLPELEILGRAEAARRFDALAPIFFAAPAEPFAPYHTLD
jgi:hypothetical protein